MTLKSAIGASFLFLIIFQCKSKESDPHNFVYNLYSSYNSQNAEFSSLSPLSIDTIFSSEFINALRESERQNQAGLGFDPVCDCQDDEGLVIETIQIMHRSQDVLAEVKFSIYSTTNHVKLKLIHKNGKWRIADIVNARGSLLETLKQNGRLD